MTPLEQEILEKLNNQVIDCIFNREAGWSKKLDDILLTSIRQAYDKGQLQGHWDMEQGMDTLLEIKSKLEKEVKQARKQTIEEVVEKLRIEPKKWTTLTTMATPRIPVNDSELQAYNYAVSEFNQRLNAL